MAQPRTIIFGLWISCLASGAHAQAQEPDAASAPEPADAGQTDSGSDYMGLIRSGLREYGLGNWSEAKAFFAQAHGVNPNARTLRGLGMASYELRSYVEAIGHFRASLANDKRPLTDELRAEVNSLLSQSLAFIARFDLAFTPPGAQLRVDAQEPVLNDEGQLMLDPGPHELVIRAEGHLTETRRIVARGGGNQRLTVDLRSLSDGADETSGPFLQTRTGQQWVGISLLGAGVVGVGVGAAFGIAAISKNNASADNCQADLCNADGLEQRSQARQAGDVATVAFIAGGALAAAGLVVYLTGAPSDDKPPPASALWLQPGGGPGEVALSLQGAFL